MTDFTLFANQATTAPPGVADVQAEGALRGATGTNGAQRRTVLGLGHDRVARVTGMMSGA